jgi:two-component system, chemotaxis family, sensor kinase CheA
VEIDLEQFKGAYFEEALENVSVIEACLLQLEQSGGGGELLNQVFRAAHSIKGGSGTFGLACLQRLTHAMESLLDPMREGTLPVTTEAIAVLLKATDALVTLLDAARFGGAEPKVETLVEALEQLTLGAATGSGAAAEQRSLPATSGGAAWPQRYTIEFEPDPELFQRGLDPVLLVRDLRSAGTVESCTLDLTKLPPLVNLEPERCYLAWRVRLAK